MFGMADLMTLGGGVALLVNTGLLLKITYHAGKIVQKIEEHERRIENLEEHEA
jgi:hypothetical protein